MVDAEGRNAFYYAHCSYHYDCANFLARNGCPRQPVPMPGPTSPVFSQPATPNILQQQQRMQQQLQQHQQQIKSSPTVNQITPKHPYSTQQQMGPPPPPPPPQQQQQQQLGSGGCGGVMMYRGSPGSQVLMPGFGPG